MRDLPLLEKLGQHLDLRKRGPRLKELKDRSDALGASAQMRDCLIASLLRVRSKKKGLDWLVPNRAQREYAKNCTNRNIVLKARQLGITTYIAARFFVNTITQPGTMTVQVAHNQSSAEEIFKIVQPGRMKLAEDRIGALEKNDIRRGVHDRLVNAAIAMAISAAIALHDHFGLK